MGETERTFQSYMSDAVAAIGMLDAELKSGSRYLQCTHGIDTSVYFKGVEQRLGELGAALNLAADAAPFDDGDESKRTARLEGALADCRELLEVREARLRGLESEVAGFELDIKREMDNLAKLYNDAARDRTDYHRQLVKTTSQRDSWRIRAQSAEADLKRVEGESRALRSWLDALDMATLADLETYVGDLEEDVANLSERLKDAHFASTLNTDSTRVAVVKALCMVEWGEWRLARRFLRQAEKAATFPKGGDFSDEKAAESEKIANDDEPVPETRAEMARRWGWVEEDRTQDAREGAQDARRDDSTG